ncbi:MAG: hypothetical protein OHK0017_04680 [Patescibacteria group bacterium]
MFKQQILPIVIAVVVFIGLSLAYLLQINLLNLVPGEKILTEVHWADVLVGLTIYLKTSIDFALLIGILMSKFPGFKNRVAIEIGTAVGNAVGTAIVLVIWYFFKEVLWLLALMILFASLVLFRLAQTSLEHLEEDDSDTQNNPKVKSYGWTTPAVHALNKILIPINKFLDPVLSKIVPDLSFKTDNISSWAGLFMASFTIPFILGMDDFAGYVPLFNVVNVFGFGLGVFLGHMILNIFLFISPNKTIQIIKNPVIAVLGSVAFIGLGIWGLYEVWHLLASHYLHLG